MIRCSTCYTRVQPGEATHACPACKAEYHRTCWDELGGCGTYGCEHAPVAHKPPPPVRVGGGWGDTKDCPSCTRAIGSSLLVCGCGAKFPWADPMTPAEYVTWSNEQRDIQGAKRWLIALFLMTLVGLPSPVTGTAAGILAYRKRNELGGAEGTFLAMGYGAAVIGATYVALFALLGAGW
jgi:hypothetical protein